MASKQCQAVRGNTFPCPQWAFSRLLLIGGEFGVAGEQYLQALLLGGKSAGRAQGLVDYRVELVVGPHQGRVHRQRVISVREGPFGVLFTRGKHALADIDNRSPSALVQLRYREIVPSDRSRLADIRFAPPTDRVDPRDENG